MPTITYTSRNRGSYTILEELEYTRVAVYCQALTLWLDEYFDGGLASSSPSMRVKGITTP